MISDHIVRSNLLSNYQELIHGVSTKKFGDMSDRSGQGNGEKQQDIFLAKLGISLQNKALVMMDATSHTENLCNVKNDNFVGRIILRDISKQILIYPFYTVDHDPNYDACISNSRHTFIAFMHGDCAPIMFYDPAAKYFGLLHASKDTVSNGIISSFLLRYKVWTELDPANLIVYVGPHICSKCYKPEGIPYNLTGQIIEQLLRGGINEANIEIEPLCTYTEEDLFFSNHRAVLKHQEGRNMAVIGLK